MKDQKHIDSRASQQGHTKHIVMMAGCCGLPLLLLAGISVYGITSASLEIMVLLICPLGMGVMMWMMMRSNRSATNETAKTEVNTAIEPTKESASIT